MSKDDAVSPPLPVYEPNDDERTWGMLAHVSCFVASALGGMSFLGPLIVWLVKKEQSPFVADQAKEALNFQLAGLLVAIVLVWTCIIPIVIVVGMIIYSIIGAMEANKGIAYRYPYTIRFIS